jgi:diacylglycerol O-acyltransferase
MATQTMSVQDALWLTMDRPNNLMVIDSVLWLSEPLALEAARAVIRERLVDRFPVFRCRPVHGEHGYEWQEAPDFDLERHTFDVELPSPVTEDVVREYFSSQRSIPLDRNHPLWQMHLINGIVRPDGQEGSAVLCRFHHSIADGIRLTQVLLAMCDAETEVDTVVTRAGEAYHGGVAGTLEAAVHGVTAVAGDLVVSAADAVSHPLVTATHVPGAVAHGAKGLFSGVLDLTLHPHRVVDALSAVRHADLEALNDVKSVYKLGMAPPSPETVWSGEPGIEKASNWMRPFSLDLVKQIGRAEGATVNDVLMSAVAGALRRYLHHHGAHLDEVVWMVPVSLMAFDAELPQDLGNHFALVMLKLPLAIEDPRELLHEVSDRMGKIKHSHEPVITFGLQRAISQTPSDVGPLLINFFANKALGVLTNVPGPRAPISFAGARVEGVLGWAPCSGDQPLTIGLFTYNETVSVTFGADATRFPDHHRLPGCFEDAMAEMYEAIVGPLPEPG